MTLSRLTKLPIHKKALIGAEVAIAVLSLYRVYDYVATGFYVSDEYGYFYAATHGTIYGGRWFFGDINILLFKIPGLGSVDGFAFILPFYLFFWGGLTIYIFYRILLLLKLDERTVALSVVSSFTLISFVLLSLGFLTEPVGLALAMGGIYSLLRFLHSESLAGRLLFPFLTAVLFGFAGATREPYDAFLIAGVFLVCFVALRNMPNLHGTKLGRRQVAAVSIIFFLLPAGFLYQENNAATSQVPSLAQQIVQAAVTNPTITAPPPTTVTSTSTVTITTTGTELVTSNGTTTTTTTTSTTTSTTTTILTTEQSYPFYAKSLILNTLVIFLGGLVLGWGPLAVVFGLLGLVIILSRIYRSRETEYVLLLAVSLVALGSYLVVSFVFAPDPSYFSFQDYSTIIRFSDTALPAYFLMAPAFLALIAKSPKRVLALAAVGISFLVIVVPVYQVYAASNFNYTSGQNPFQFGYKTDAVLLRDYFGANVPKGQAIELVGVPYGWAFTPGVQDLPINTYSIGHIAIYPELNQTIFSSLSWSTFYVYIGVNQPIPPEQAFLADILNSTSETNQSNFTSFSVVDKQPVLHGAGTTLYEVQLQWQ